MDVITKDVRALAKKELAASTPPLSDVRKSA